ncbi:hypothetical protein F511_04133 [Dorcoceras hygrometricum]|nr:hypothetical protein F511_04133 [Dorcoceras hygrometricum]
MRATSSDVQTSPRITCAQQRPISIATWRPARCSSGRPAWRNRAASERLGAAPRATSARAVGQLATSSGANVRTPAASHSATICARLRGLRRDHRAAVRARLRAGSDTEEYFVADKATKIDVGKESYSEAHQEQIVAQHTEVSLSKTSTAEGKLPDEELVSIDDLLMQIYDVWSYCRHPRKQLLDAPDTVTGNPAKEMVQLICGDVYFLVQIRQQRNASEEVLESHRKYFAPSQPWTAMASQIIDLLSAAHLKSLEELLAQQKEHGIQLAVGSQPLRLRNHNFGLTHRIMVKHLATSPHDLIGITDSVCKNQSVMVSVQYGPCNTYIPIRSTTIGISRVARDPITIHTSRRSNSDIACVTSIGYPCIKASGESSTTKHRLLHTSGPHPISPPNDPNRVGKRVKVRHLSCRVSMMFRVVRTNQYNQDLGLIHSTNGNHLESANESSSIDHQVTIHLHAQNITMFPTNETWYFTSQMLV